jgi:hypothetical protein
MSDITTRFKRRYGGGATVVLLAVSLIVAAPARGHATTITVTSTSDPSASGQCTLRDAINVALGNAITPDACASSGSGANYTIVFAQGLSGTITLSSDGELPAISGINLTISGPRSGPGITIDGGSQYQILEVESGAALNLRYLTFTDGIVSTGGAINNSGTLTVTNSTFTGNFAGGAGGAINSFGTLTVTNSTFTGNNAGFGGAISNFGGPLTVTNSTFTGNFTDSIFGGAIDNEAGTLTVTNSTFTGNNAPVGAAIFNDFGTLTVTNSTFTGNNAPGGGATIFNDFGTADLKGTILATSSGSNCHGGDTDEGYNLSDDDSCEFSQSTSENNVTDADLNLDPNGLQDNGGPTQTIALEAGSVAINQIPVADCTDQSNPPVRLLTDQRGVTRPQFTACDIGAYEYDTARSLKTNVLNAINGTTGVNPRDQRTLKLAAGSLYQAALLLSSGGNSVNPALGGAEFLAEKTAVQFLTGIAPSSELPESTLETWLFNITLADRTLAVVAIANAGGNAGASQLVATGDAQEAAGDYLGAVISYQKAWSLVTA